MQTIRRFSVLLLVAVSMHLPAAGQWGISGYADFGRYSHTLGLPYTAPVLQGSYNFGKYHVGVGCRWYTSGIPESDGFNGLSLGFSRDFYPGKGTWPLTLGAFYKLNTYTGILNETNVGIAADYNRNHFRWQVGAHTRIWSLTEQGRLQFGVAQGDQSRSVERMNFIWSMTYSLKPIVNHWNLYGRITNFDNFLLLQEVNPMVAVGYRHQFPSKLTFFAEFWYRSAGLMNIQVNYYGYHARVGLGWYFQKESK